MKKIGLYFILLLGSFVSAFPLYYLFISTTNSAKEIGEGKLTIGKELSQNLTELFSTYDFVQLTYNTLKITVISVVLSLAIASLSAYGFEKYQTKFSERIYTVLLMIMIVPQAALIVPLFKMMAGWNLVNTPWSVIFPSITNIFLIFFFRQGFKLFPDDIIEAAKIDGANGFKTFYAIVVPSMKSTFASGTILSFLSNWNAFLIPLIMLQTDDQATLPLLISGLSTASYETNYHIQMLAIALTTIPTLFLFIFVQRYFMEGMQGSIKR